MNKKLNITEADVRRIKKMYNLPNKKDYVFDFVLTENNKYLIIMDQLFVAGGNGRPVGSIWENTYVFDEILKESIEKGRLLTESVQNIIEWTKEMFENNLIIEQYAGAYSNTNSEWTGGKPTGPTADQLDKAEEDFSKSHTWNDILYKGIIPALRWVRRGLYTGVGIVVDVVLSILTVKTNVAIWIVIVILDIYEIITGDYDPEDPMRAQVPYFLLFADLLGAVFTSATAMMARKSVQVISKEGLKAVPLLLKPAKGLLEKLPSFRSTIMDIAKQIGGKSGKEGAGFLSKLLSGLDKVLNGFEKFLSQLLTPAAQNVVKAGTVGGATLAGTKAVELGIPYVDKKNKLGQGIMNLNNYMGGLAGRRATTITQEDLDLLSQAGYGPSQ